VSAPETPALDVAALVSDPATRVVVTCGSGGVGKTTTAAAIALAAAEAGRRTVVLTIDPALRLAQSLGLSELDNTPREVEGIDTSAGGALFAMMLDMKRTFDEVVTAHTTPERAQAIFDNPFYQSLSSSFAGTQEYMAMEKLSQLRLSDQWDLVVVDTPPSRSALDFLDAPQRLGRFLDGRMIRLLTAPARAGGRAYVKVVSASFGVFSRLLDRILGGELLRDVSAFVSALETMFGGFRERAQQTYELLKAPGTAFVVVAVPETAALREASYFVARLGADEMPLAGIVVNRVQQHTAPGLSATKAEAAAEDIEAAAGAAADATDTATHTATDTTALDAQIAVAALRAHVETAGLVDAQSRLIRRLAIAHSGVPMRSVPALASDVHDLDGLREIGMALGTAPGSR
jgi:anion-transporting  ArsA/GET3 family ATPase